MSIAIVQERLRAAGFDPGAVDGAWGPQTAAALDAALAGRKADPASKSSFDTALAEILRHEGGWVDHPKDPGGATNLGVTIGTLSDWLGRAATKAEVRALTVEAVSPIYRKNYWDKVRGDELPPGVDLMVFDLAVNSGPARAARFLQEVVGTAVDGAIGPATIARVAALHPRVVIDGMRAKREAFYRSLGTFSTFGKGWMKRLNDVTAKAREMAS